MAGINLIKICQTPLSVRPSPETLPTQAKINSNIINNNNNNRNNCVNNNNDSNNNNNNSNSRNNYKKVFNNDKSDKSYDVSYALVFQAFSKLAFYYE